MKSHDFQGPEQSSGNYICNCLAYAENIFLRGRAEQTAFGLLSKSLEGGEAGAWNTKGKRDRGGSTISMPLLPKVWMLNYCATAGGKHNESDAKRHRVCLPD